MKFEEHSFELVDVTANTDIDRKVFDWVLKSTQSIEYRPIVNAIKIAALIVNYSS